MANAIFRRVCVHDLAVQVVIKEVEELPDVIQVASMADSTIL